MTRRDFILPYAVTALLIALLAVIVVRLIQRQDRVSVVPIVNISNSNTSTQPEGMVVALNSPAEQADKHVLVNYIAPSGETVRTRQIPNATVQTATFQVVQDDVFVYTEKGDEPGLRRMDEEGSLAAMADMKRGNSYDPFWMVSPDGTLIAWSETSYASPVSTSTLYQARVDGSLREQVAQVSAEGEFYLRPFAWIKNENGEWEVWYVRQPIGLGGYILFSDPYGPVYKNETLALDMTTAFTDISQDGLAFAFLDRSDAGELSVHVIDFSLPLLGAGQAGEAKLSPDNSLLAIAVASGNPDQESGWVEIWPIGSQASVRVTPENTTDVIRVVDWLDEDTLALTVLDNENLYESEIFLVNADGSFFRKTWSGYPVGVVPAP